MNKPIRKLTTKKLFGTKTHDDLIIKLKPIVEGLKSEKFFINGNLFQTSGSNKNDLEYILFEDGIDWINSEYNWITFGLCRANNLSDYNFDYLPEKGYAYLRNHLAEITLKLKEKLRPYGIKGDDFSQYRPESYSHPLLFEIQSGIWKEGLCKGSLNKTTIDGGELDCIVFGYGMDDENINISPSNILCGYDLTHLEGKHFYGRKVSKFSDYQVIELITQPISSYLIITDIENKEIAIKLNSRYSKDDWDKATEWSEPNPISQLTNNIERVIIENEGKENPISEKEYLTFVNQEVKKIKQLCIPNFSYSLFPTLEEISIPWEKIRSDYENKGFVRVGEPFNLCGNLDIKEVKSIRIADDFDYIPDLNTEIELNQKNGFKEEISVALSFDLKEDFFDFQELKKDIINNGKFLSQLRDTADLVAKNYISGYGTTFELKAFFDSQGEIDSNRDDVNQKVAYLKKVKNVFIDNITDAEIKQRVIDLIKNTIHSKSNNSQSIDSTALSTTEIDFSKDPRIGINSKVEFLIISNDDENQLNNFRKEVETGEFFSNLVRIKKLVTNEYINGYYGRLEIKDFFNEHGEQEPESEDVKKALDYLCGLSNNIIPKIKEPMISDALKSIIKLTING